MLPLISAVFAASLLGSLHCAGMCGAFVAMATLPGPERPSTAESSSFVRRMLHTQSRAALNASYNLGRLLTYITLGAIAGTLGAALDLGGSLVGLQRAAAIIAGACMIVFGLLAVLRTCGVAIPRMPLPRGLTTLAKAAHGRVFDFPPALRALSLGLLTTLLPCGWLYAFVITSAGTAHPLPAMLTMAAFWAGTLPVLVSLGVGLSALTGSLRRHVPLATSLLLVVVGLATVLGRMALPISTEALAVPASMQDAEASIQNAHEVCPLCRPKHGH